MIGTGTFDPKGQFAFPRSYIKGISLRLTGGSPVWTGNVLTTGIAAFPTTTLVWVFYENFIPWNSNMYTLDHLVVESYFFNSPDFVHHPLPYKVGIWRPTPEAARYIYILEPEFDGTTHFEHDLESAPADYWLPEL